MKAHLSTFEPQLDELKSKYDAAMREKMVYKLEKEKLQNELNASKLGTSTPVQSKGICERDEWIMIRLWFVASTDKGLGPTQTKLRELRVKEEKKRTVTQTAEQRRLAGSTELANESHPKV